MNAIMKFSGVSGEGVARLIQLLGQEWNHELDDQFPTLDCHLHQDARGDMVERGEFRWVSLLKVEPEAGHSTYEVTLKVIFAIWPGKGKNAASKLGNGSFQAILRALDRNILPTGAS